MELVDADLRETLRAFGSIVQARVSIDASLQGTVTVDLHNTPAREALDAVCRMQGCAWELQETEEGPVLLVVRRR
jgi:type II secretory pathway component GspD/PulD (secretin)